MDNAVLTIGSLQAGTKENIIPDEATIKLNMRTFDEDVREYMLASIRRICCAECDASNAERPPEFTTLSTYLDGERCCGHESGGRSLQSPV